MTSMLFQMDEILYVTFAKSLPVNGILSIDSSHDMGNLEYDHEAPAEHACKSCEVLYGEKAISIASGDFWFSPGMIIGR